jgi:hypothetical protein
MTGTSPDDAMAALLIRELHQLLTGEGIAEAVNLRITQEDRRVLIHVMGVSTGSLGMLLAALSDPAELDDPDSLTCRITPGDHRSGPAQWQYQLIAGRYPSDNAIVFAAKVTLPVSDLPEVVSRLRNGTRSRSAAPPSSP